MSDKFFWFFIEKKLSLMVKEVAKKENGASAVVQKVAKKEEQEQQQHLRKQRRRGRRRRRRGRIEVCESEATIDATRETTVKTTSKTRIGGLLKRDTKVSRNDNGVLLSFARMKGHAASWSFALLAATIALVPATHTPPFEHAA